MDKLCKQSKFDSLQRVLKSIRERVDAWVAYVDENPSVQGMKELFSTAEVDQMATYVPRCKLSPLY